MMQALKKVDGKWKEEKPEDLNKWIWANDGQEAVVKDGPLTYCATEELKAAYEAKGKKAAMFIDLARKLHDERPQVDLSDSTAWCATYGLICSEREDCKEDCCYQKRGMK